MAKQQKRTDVQPQPLIGEALLRKVKDLEHLNKEEKARECGYYTLTKKWG